MLNLDTHILLYALNGELTPKETRALAVEAWSISAIVLWEIAKLAELGRIEVDLDDAELTRVLSRIHTWPITLDICRALRTLDFRSDPADELIAATSLVHRLPLVTRDRTIRRSRKVPMVR
jgi:PIN domain nuclease of toxin-antitoxin system